MWLLHKRYQQTVLLSSFFGAVLVGIAAARFFRTSLQVEWILGALFCVLYCLRFRRTAAIVSVCFLGLAVGWWRGGTFASQLEPYSELSGKKVTIQVTADTSAVYGQNSQLEFDGTNVKIIEPYEVKVPGKMLISGFGENSVLRGDTVRVTGKIHTRRGSRQAGISYGQLDVIMRSASFLEKFRRSFLAGLATALPEPHDQFSAGLLIGQRSELPESVSTTLRAVGLSHIIAVSGYNLTIMADVARKRFGKKSKFRSTVFSIVLVLCFVAIAGSSASIARAAFVSILTIIAAHYGRSVKPVLLLLLAACYTAFLNPLNIWTDIGWYLSFLAFFGVLVVAPTIQKRLYKEREPHVAVKILLETASAQIMTVPIVLYIFGQVSLIALAANILVVPLVPLAMLLSAIAGLAGMFVPALAGVLALPAKLILDFMLMTADLLSRIPHAFISTTIEGYYMVGIYILVVVLLLVARQKTRKSATITE